MKLEQGANLKKFKTFNKNSKKLEKPDANQKLNLLANFLHPSQSSAGEVSRKPNAFADDSNIESEINDEESSDADSIQQCLRNNSIKVPGISNNLMRNKNNLTQGHVVLNSESARINNWLNTREERKANKKEEKKVVKATSKITSFFSALNVNNEKKKISIENNKRLENTFIEKKINYPVSKENDKEIYEKTKKLFGSECPICYTDLNMDNLTKFLVNRCEHMACETCWKQSLEEKLECMICRNRTRYKMLNTLKEYFGNN
jgi:predicted transcriptional regulator